MTTRSRYRGTCRACAAEVLWTTTEAGKRLAVNATVDPLGLTAVRRDEQNVLHSRTITPDTPPMPWERRYRPHAATCPGSVQQLPLPTTVRAEPQVRPQPRRDLPDNVLLFRRPKKRDLR